MVHTSASCIETSKEKIEIEIRAIWEEKHYEAKQGGYLKGIFRTDKEDKGQTWE